MFLIPDIGYNLQETYGSLYNAFIARKSVKRTELLCIGSFIIMVRFVLDFAPICSNLPTANSGPPMLWLKLVG